MKWLLTVIVSFCVCLSLDAFEAKTLSFSEIKAQDASYDGRSITLIGDVAIDHNFGALRCDRATVFLKPVVDAGAKGSIPEKIVLIGHVHAKLKNGNMLDADKAEINCIDLEGVFTAEAPRKVEYVAFMGEGDNKVPVKTCGHAISLKMKKEPNSSEYVVAEMKGEGDVSIEYQAEKKEVVEKAVTHTEKKGTKG